MNDVEIKSLSCAGTETVIDAFLRAFADYAVSFDRNQIEAMLVRRGFCADMSYGAFVGNDIVAFTLNGVGEYDGVPTCYDCGTGTVPQYRGQGLAGKIFNYSIPYLHNAGVRQYILEVLQDNSAAISVYESHSFKVVAEYDCYNQAVAQLNASSRKGIEIQDVSIDAVAGMQGFCDFKPSWQNDMGSITRGASGLIMKGALIDGNMVGYIVCDPLTGDIAQLAVDPAYRRNGVASSLLAYVLSQIKSPSVKMINVECGCQSLGGFLSKINMTKGLAQYAMTRSI